MSILPENVSSVKLARRIVLCYSVRWLPGGLGFRRTVGMRRTQPNKETPLWSSLSLVTLQTPSEGSQPDE
jgi:hypothetical protein